MHRVYKSQIELEGKGPYEPISRASFYRQVAKLKSMYPTEYPVRYTFGAVPGDDQGQTDAWGKNGKFRFRVWVNDKLQRAPAIDTLIHEHAHVLRDEERIHDGTFWISRTPEEEHDARFCEIWSNVYNAWSRVPYIP